MRKLLIVAIVCLLVLPSLVVAQDNWQTYENGGFEISFPEDWTLTEQGDNVYIVNNETLDLNLFIPDVEDDDIAIQLTLENNTTVDFAAGTTADYYMGLVHGVYLFLQALSGETDEADIDIGDTEIADFEARQGVLTWDSLIIDVRNYVDGDNFIFLVIFRTPEADTDLIEEIVASIELNE